MVASPIFKLAGKLASNLASRSGSGLPRIEKIFGTPPRVPSPTTIEKIARSDEAFARGPVEYSRYRGPMEEVDEVILDAPLSRPERDYFANISKSGSGFTEKKLTAKDVEFFEDMMREGDPYDFMADIPSAKIRTDKKGNKYLRVQGEEDMNNLFKFIMDGPWDKGDLPPSLRRWDWDRSFKDVKEFKHGGGLSSVNKPITINGQPHSLAWIRPDEASALKAMGGSGKKVGGIPAYDTTGFEVDIDEDFYADPTDTAPVQTTTTSNASDSGDTTSDPVYAAQQNKMLADADAMERQYGDAYELQRSTDEESPTGYLESYGGGEGITSESLIEKGIPKKLVPYWNALKDRGMTNKEVADYLAGMGAEQLTSMEAAYDTGYSFGGPMGTMEGLSRDMATVYASKLDLKGKMKKLKDIEDDDTLSEEQREEKREELYSSLSKTARDTGGVYNKRKRFGTEGWFGKDFDKVAASHNLSPVAAAILKYGAPGAAIPRGLGGLADLIADAVGDEGTFTTEAGKEFSIRNTGKLIEQDMAAIPTEDSPEPVTEIARAVAPTTEVVAEAGPMEAYQTGLQSIESNEGIENSIQILMNNSGVSESEARRMLGLDVNIA